MSTIFHGCGPFVDTLGVRSVSRFWAPLTVERFAQSIRRKTLIPLHRNSLNIFTTNY